MAAGDAKARASDSDVGKVSPAAVGRKRGGVKIVAALLMGAMLIGGGFWIGKATTDPTTSTEYAALGTKAAAADKDRDLYLEQRDILQQKVATMEVAVGKREDAVLLAEAALKTNAEGVKKREDAVTGAEKTQAANAVADGTWVVGVDIEPGTYKAKADVGSRCYWGIYATGSNGDDIINNDIPGGGLPSVTLAAGQDFKSARCGSWTKQ